MITSIEKRVYGPVYLPNSSTSLATCPALKTWIIKEIRIVNMAATDATAKFGINGVGGGKEITPDLKVLGTSGGNGGLVVEHGWTVLAAGESIYGIASLASTLTVTISVVETG